MLSVFVRQKVAINGNVRITDHLSKIWLPDCSKLVINWKDVADIMSLSFFWRFLFYLSSLVTVPSFMSISLLVLELWLFLFIKGLTRNPGIGNMLVWVFSNIWRLERVRDIKFDRKASKEKLFNAAKCHYSFYLFWVNKGKPNAGEVKIMPSILGLKAYI